MTSQSKCLVINPDPTCLGKAVSICNSLNKKNGPFEVIVLLGDIISSANAKISEIGSPLEDIYHSEGKYTYNSDDVSELRFLGKVGITEIGSLKIGFVTGRLDEVTEEDLKMKLNENVDILISYQWPKLISDEERLSAVGNAKLDDVLKAVKPRYWFCVGSGESRFFERLPFKWEDEGSGERVTRFISLAQYGSKEKWYYAFNIRENCLDDVKSVSKMGEFPVPISQKRNHMKEEDEGTNSTKRPRKAKSVITVSPGDCFFCLSNPKVELHMIISIGDYSYMTVAKGPLTLKKSELGFSGHGLIVPINHYPTLKKYRDAEEPGVNVQDTRVYKEVEQFKTAVIKMFQSMGDYCVVFWEISRSNGVHFHTQYVPILSKYEADFEKCIQSQIDYATHRFGEDSKLSYNKYDMKSPQSEVFNLMNSDDYMLMTIAKAPEQMTRYLFRIGDEDGDESERRVDLQFPRKVVAFLLNLGRRVRWDKCKESMQQETEQRDLFQKHFKPFDFTLEK
ncbi:hypothetical protein FOA43_000823 [Brettanomyces nanus]|uniref:Uncharacterized protein n=1 Tax=Eeniella nana TaxID=13502 RepID=A0A875S063_EENNA|nr:uncharacterized protein FOA43_000823 [Brettanomyces nanus]QPG73512.1 hypothetical protein FOA43_000823 [Brettanomyces nanus]